MKKYVSGRYAVKTDVGLVRLSNEDRAVGLAHPSGYFLFIVCDGMGGQNKGELASTLAVESISENFTNHGKFLSIGLAKNWVISAIKKANKEIHNIASEKLENKGMGTTLTLALIIKDSLIIAQAGDSRCYSLSNGITFKQLTEDQSYVAYLNRIGQISSEEMKTHPKRNVVMNAIGVYPSVDIDVKILPYNNETLLLCSDGLYNNVSENDIKSILKSHDSPELKANTLVSRANSNGGSDNIAVIIWEAQQ